MVEWSVTSGRRASQAAAERIYSEFGARFGVGRRSQKDGKNGRGSETGGAMAQDFFGV